MSSDFTRGGDHGQDRLFEDTPTYPVQLVSNETFKTGVLNLSYVPADG
jgi:hypothetical protein